MLDKNGNKYDLFLCQKMDSFIDEAEKYQEKQALYEGRIDTLPATVGDLSKQEILDEISKNRDHSNFIYLFITPSPITDNGFQKNGKKYALFLSQKLDNFIDEVRKHQEKPVFADRINALPTKFGEVLQQDVLPYISRLPYYSNYTYLLITLIK